MSRKLKVLAVLNLIGWAIVVPVLVSSLVSPLLDYTAKPDAVGTGEAGTTQLAPLGARPNTGRTGPSAIRPSGRTVGEQLPIPTRVLRQAGVATPVRTGPLTDGIPSGGTVRVQPGPQGVPSVQIVSTGTTEGTVPSLPDTPGTGTIVPPVVSPGTGPGEPTVANPVPPTAELPSPTSDGDKGQIAEGPPVVDPGIITEPPIDRPLAPEVPSVPSPSPTPVDTATPVPTDTATPVPTATDTPTAAPTDTSTPAPTATATSTATAAPTDTPTAAPTDTPTAAPTDTPTAAPTDTPTAAPTDTPTAAPTDTATPVPTSTPAPPAPGDGDDDPQDPQHRKAPLAIADRPKAVVESKDEAPEDDE